MCNLEHSISKVVSTLSLTAIMAAGTHADGLQPFEYTSQQDYQLPTLMAAADNPAVMCIPTMHWIQPSLQ